MNIENIDVSIAALLAAYHAQEFTPRELITELWQKARRDNAHNPAWIYLLTEAELEGYLTRLEERPSESLPLYGIPFAIKDNIDLAGVPTTAACPAFSFIPEQHATVVQKLLDAGAIPLGKTNLDQFATGLNGTRTPYGIPHNPRNPEYISGGSSSGSAVALAMNQVSFALGTDTAGSGRVPAALNHLIGLKSSKGLLSCHGVLPACRSLDCVSVFAFNCDDANTVLAVAEGRDEQDCYSRPNLFHNHASRYGEWKGTFKIGIPLDDQLDFGGDRQAKALFEAALQRLADMGGIIVKIDCSPFLEAAKLLYEGPWIAERYVVLEEILKMEPDNLLPVIRSIVGQAESMSAADVFRAQYTLQSYAQRAEAVMQSIDILAMPTMPTAFTIQQLQENPVTPNSALGTYTNFVNLLDMSALALPAGFLDSGVGWGITLLGRAFDDRKLLSIGNRYTRLLPYPPANVGADHFVGQTTVAEFNERMDLVVCGAHLSGMPLNHQLTDRQALLQSVTTTAEGYRLYALPDGRRPALIRTEPGRSIEVEVWSIPKVHLGSFISGIDAPLGIGKVELSDGRMLSGFIATPDALVCAEDITDWGGWRAWINRGK